VFRPGFPRRGPESGFQISQLLYDAARLIGNIRRGMERVRVERPLEFYRGREISGVFRGSGAG